MWWFRHLLECLLDASKVRYSRRLPGRTLPGRDWWSMQLASLASRCKSFHSLMLTNSSYFRLFLVCHCDGPVQGSYCGLFLDPLATEHCCFMLCPSPICSCSIALFQPWCWCPNISALHLRTHFGWFSGKELLYSPGNPEETERKKKFQTQNVLHDIELYLLECSKYLHHSIHPLLFFRGH